MKLTTIGLVASSVVFGVLVLVTLLLVGKRKQDGGYDQGLLDGARFTTRAFLRTNAYLAPLVLTNQNVVLNDCLFITIVESGPALVISSGTSNVTVQGGRIYGGY